MKELKIIFLKVICAIILTLGLMMGSKFLFNLNKIFYAEEINITVYPFHKDIYIDRVSPYSNQDLIQKDANSTEWTARQFFKKIIITFPLHYIDSLKLVEVKIGKKNFTFNKEEFLKYWLKIKNIGGYVFEEKYESPQFVSLKHSILPRLSSAINLRADLSILKITSQDIIFSIFLFIFWFLLLLNIGFLRRAFEYGFNKISFIFIESTKTNKQFLFDKSSLTALLIGLLFLSVSLIFLEKMQPYYFSQDDNFVQFLPGIIHGCRSFFQGVFSTLNPYQLNGSPNSSLGIYALTYPFTYVSYFISNMISRNGYLTIEVFAVLHLVLGYCATFWLFRMSGMRPILSLVASLCFVLSGYNLIAGRSWYYMLPVVLWSPFLVFSVIKFKENRLSWLWILYTGIIIGIFFHAGNAQMWLYALLFFFLALGIILLTDNFSIRKILYVISAFSLGLAIALPLLVPTLLATAGIPRGGVSGGGIGRGFLAMFLPYPIIKAAHPNGWCNLFKELTGQMYYSGSIFSIVGFFAMVILVINALLFRKNFNKKIIRDNLWLIIAFIVLLFALGDNGVLWIILSFIPPFNKFYHPFKFLLFVNLFMILAAGIILERYLEKKRLSNQRLIIFSVFILLLLFYHVSLCKTSFYTFGNRPYPALPQEVFRLLSSENNLYPQRIYVNAPSRSPDKDYVFSLAHNIPTVYKIPSLWGYEHFTIHPNYDVKSLYEYGVKYVLSINATTDFPTSWMPLPDRKILKQKEVLRFNNVIIYELFDTVPLSFLRDNPSRGLPILFTARGAIVDVSSLSVPRDIVVNLFYRQGIVALADGKQLKVSADDWGRILVQDCPAVKKIEIRYVPPWDKGFIFAAIMLFFSLVLSATLILKERRR